MYMDDYKRWLAADLEDPALTRELKAIEGSCADCGPFPFWGDLNLNWVLQPS